MNTRLLFGVLLITPTLCFGALSTTTSYFLNVEALTNVTARSAVRGLTGAFTNGLTAGASTFTGNAVTEIPVAVNVTAGSTNKWQRWTDGTSIDIHLGKYFFEDLSAGNFASITLENADSLGNPFWRGKKARGNLGAKTAVQTGDYLSAFSGVGHDGTSYSVHSDSSFELHASAAFTTSSHPTYMTWLNTALNSTSKVEQMRLNSEGALGLGSTVPFGKFDVVSSSGTTSNNLVFFGGFSSTANSGLVFRRSRNTFSSPTAVQQGDVLGSLSGLGYDTQSWGTTLAAGVPVTITFFADETYSSTAHGSYLTMGTTPNGSATRVERLRITSAGNTGLATPVPTSTLHVAGSAAYSIATGTAFTLTATNEVYLVNVDAQTVTLPTAVGVNGRTYTVKTIAPAETATIATTSSQLIDGATTYSLSASNKFVRVISDNARWWIIGNN